MPVRIRITLIFTLLVFIILSIVCGTIYYFSYTSRIHNIKTILTNRAITTARRLSQSDIFGRQLLERIDSSSAISLKNKTVEAFDYGNHKMYSYSDVPGDTLPVDNNILNKARPNKVLYFVEGAKEAVALGYQDAHKNIVVVYAGEDEEGKAGLYELQSILWVSFLAGLIVALAGGYLFSERLLQPIKNITHEVKEISAQNMTRRIHTGSTKDEWYHLSETLNDLLNRLQESFELQRRFISNASHELSTPLTSISSQLEVSLLQDRSEEEYKRVQQSVLYDVQHMNKLTQTLLEFAKASGDNGGLEINLIRLDEILLGLPFEVQRLDKAFSVILDFNQLPAEEERLLVYGNAALLHTAIRNVVLNACKYSADHRAEVRLIQQGQYLVVTIKDHGIGIPQHELTNIFQPFYRVNDNQSIKSFGLGLSLSQRIIKIHKGEIVAESEEAKGTMFHITLPIAERL